MAEFLALLNVLILFSVSVFSVPVSIEKERPKRRDKRNAGEDNKNRNSCAFYLIQLRTASLHKECFPLSLEVSTAPSTVRTVNTSQMRTQSPKKQRYDYTVRVLRMPLRSDTA